MIIIFLVPHECNSEKSVMSPFRRLHPAVFTSWRFQYRGELTMSTSFLSKLANLGIVVLIAGCATAAVGQLESKLEPVALEKFKKMFIAVNVESFTFNSKVSNSMQKQLAKSLSGCGVDTYFYSKNDLDSDPEAIFKKAYADFNPDSFLTIAKTEDRLIVQQRSAQGLFTFVARLSQGKPSTQVWAAKGAVGLVIDGNAQLSGEIIADAFFKKMVADGLVCKN
jgi:hypothetical protein